MKQFPSDTFRGVTNATRVSLPVLEKLRELARGGAVIVGQRPQGSPSLADDPAKVKAVLDELWPGSVVTPVGKGRVFAAADAAPALQAIGLTPDFTYEKTRPDSWVMFIHRRLADGDAYFVANRRDRAETVRASFRVTGKTPALWDPATGLSSPASFRAVSGRTEVTIPLDRLGSVFVVFRKAAAGAAPSYNVAQPQWRTTATLAGPWQVSFQPDRGAPPRAVFTALQDFRENANPGIRYFSGIASYPHMIDVAAGDLAGGRKVWLDLGEVNNLAEVWINGARAGTAWKPPFRVDVTRFVKPGRNRIEIRVVNLWVNRLIGDVQPGVAKKITFTAADGKISPDTPPEEGAAERRMPYDAKAPLVPSGLVGPVRIMVEQPGTAS